MKLFLNSIKRFFNYEYTFRRCSTTDDDVSRRNIDRDRILYLYTFAIFFLYNIIAETVCTLQSSVTFIL